MAVIFAAGSCIWANDYTLENCFDAALRSDYSLSIINDEIGKKILERRDALSSYYPVIGAIGNIQYKSEVPTLDLSLLGMGGGTAELGTSLTYDFSIYMNQIIFDGLSRKYTRLLSENGLNRELQKKTLREDVINQTILQLSYSYTLSTLNIETLTTSMKRLGFNLNQVKLFVDQGFSSELDLLDIQTKLKELEQEKLSLESNRRKILLQISELTGTDWQLYFTGGLLVELNLWEGGRRAALLRRDNLSLNQNAKSRDAYIRALYFDTMRKFDELVSLKDQRPAICRDQASASEEPAGKPSVSDCPGQRHSVQDETHSSL